MIGIKPPKTTAPRLIPVVNPAFTNPTNNPLFLLFVNSSTKIIAVTNMPAPPMPDKTLPSMKTDRLCACDDTKPPKTKKIEVIRMMSLGEKIAANRPAKGPKDDMAMRYDEVNHVALSYASNSAAIVLCAIVMPDILLAWRNTRIYTLITMAIPLRRLTFTFGSSRLVLEDDPSWGLDKRSVELLRLVQELLSDCSNGVASETIV